jgi:hypothetical protein
MNSDWRAELRGLPTEDYFATCTHITTINFRGYLMFTLKDDGYMKWQAHSDWKDTFDHVVLQCKHLGLLRKGKELQRTWNNNAYNHINDMHRTLSLSNFILSMGGTCKSSIIKNAARDKKYNGWEGK